jgi:hypothetical protein
MAAVRIHGGQHVAFDASGAWMCGTGRHDRKDLVDGASGVVVAHAGDVAPGHLPCGCIRVRVLGIARGGDVRDIPPGCLATARVYDTHFSKNETVPVTCRTQPTLDTALVDLGMTLFKALGVPEEALKSPLLVKAMPFLVPLALHYLATEYPGMVPQTENVKAACSYALTGKTFETVMPHVALLREKIEVVAAVGAKMAASAATAADGSPA